MAIFAGKLVICGKPSKAFNPYMPLRGAVKSLEDARDKLLVNFDPTTCFLEDLKVKYLLINYICSFQKES